MTSLPKGANLIISRLLLQSDGVTPLDVSSLVSLTLRLFQANLLNSTYALGSNPQLRAGTAANQIDFEITSDISGALSKGPVAFQWTIVVDDVLFIVQPGVAIEILTETPLFIT